MNLDMLYEATKLTGNPKYANVANHQAEKSMTSHVRPDGTTYHVVNFDQNTGKVLECMTAQGESLCLSPCAFQPAVRAASKAAFQLALQADHSCNVADAAWVGYADDSVWSRGQAWGIYGYAQCGESFPTHPVTMLTFLRQLFGQDGKTSWILLGNLQTSFWSFCQSQACHGGESLCPTHTTETAYEDIHFVQLRTDLRLIERNKALTSHRRDFSAPTPCPYDASAGTIAARGLQMLHGLLMESNPTASKNYAARGEKLIRDVLRECLAPAAKLKDGKVDWGKGDWETILMVRLYGFIQIHMAVLWRTRC